MTESKFLAAELFAGVGGFRLAIENVGGQVVFSNQWEPSTKVQHASDVYVARFGPDGHSNEDIATVDSVPASFNLLVGGFPCQDYSVAKSLSSANGLEGKKGVLWWEIFRLLSRHEPEHVLLENVDRLLKSPSHQRGRDFAVMLRTLMDLGYSVQWSVINAADYGFAQRRRRVFLYATKSTIDATNDKFLSSQKSVFSQAFPGVMVGSPGTIDLSQSAPVISKEFNVSGSKSPFKSRGYAADGNAFSYDYKPVYEAHKAVLGDILEPSPKVPEKFWISEEDLPKWEFLKGSKKLERTHVGSGFKYLYSEGPVKFPDPIDTPSRTILTAEGGATPSRFKHAVLQEGRLRRLMPIELERLNGFPDNWTLTGSDGSEVADTKRAFFMGNALVVGVVERILREMRP